MRDRVLITLILLAIPVLLISCTKPASQPERYLGELAQNDKPIQPIDLSEMEAEAESDAGEVEDSLPDFFKEISARDLPKCLDQFAAVKRLFEESKKEVTEFGTKPFRFNINRKVFVRGDAVHKHGGDLNPIPLFKTWRSGEYNDIKSVDSWVTHSSIVEITSLRRTDEGNMYYVKLPHGGLRKIEGWIHEDMLASP